MPHSVEGQTEAQSGGVPWLNLVTRTGSARSSSDFPASKKCHVLFNASVQLSEQGLTFPINSEHVYMYVFNFNHLLV